MWDKDRFGEKTPLPMAPTGGRLPPWLKRPMPKGKALWETRQVVEEERLHTVCEESKCPNLPECWSKKTATFLALGKECTRNCGFCDIDFTKMPKEIDPEEPKRIAESVKKLGLRHVVITMVARDDQADGGASHIAAIIHEIRRHHPSVTIEVLTSDFQGARESIDTVLAAKPDIFNHNIETVERLTQRVRHRATYRRTLEILNYAASSSNLFVKSGIMVGLGESEEEVFQTLRDLRDVGCTIVTIGQYLQPQKRKLRVQTYIPPEQFKNFERYGNKIGIPHVYSGPFVRSSYNAAEVLDAVRQLEIS